MGVPHDHRCVLPPPQLLNRVEIHSILNQPGCKGVAKIMEPKTLDLCFLPSRVKSPQQVPVVQPFVIAIRKNVVRLLATRTFSPSQDAHNRLIYRKGIHTPVLLLHDHYGPPPEVDLGPRQIQDLALTETRVNRKGDHVLKPRRRFLQQPPLFLKGQPPFLWSILSLSGNHPDGVFLNPLPLLHGNGKNMTHQGELQINRLGGSAFLSSFHLVFGNARRADLSEKKLEAHSFLKDVRGRDELSSLLLRELHIVRESPPVTAESIYRMIEDCVRDVPAISYKDAVNYVAKEHGYKAAELKHKYKRTKEAYERAKQWLKK